MTAAPMPAQPDVETTAGATSAGAGSPLPPNDPATAVQGPAWGGDFLILRIWAESFEDAQRARVSCENRMRRGGVDPDLFLPTFEMQEAAEHALGLALRRSYRTAVRTHCPGVEEWAKANAGIGEHLLARLLGVLGHPRHAQPYRWMDDAPDDHECAGNCGDSRHLVALPPFERSVRQLWAFCGHGDPTRKRRKGMDADEAAGLGNPRAKMLAHLLAECAMKCRPRPVTLPLAGTPTAGAAPSETPPKDASTAERRTAGSGSTGQPKRSSTAEDFAADRLSDRPAVVAQAMTGTADRYFYRHVYDAARAKYATRDDWTLGHQHNAALHLVAKEILRDLWRASLPRSTADEPAAPVTETS